MDVDEESKIPSAPSQGVEEKAPQKTYWQAKAIIKKGHVQGFCSARAALDAEKQGWQVIEQKPISVKISHAVFPETSGDRGFEYPSRR